MLPTMPPAPSAPEGSGPPRDDGDSPPTSADAVAGRVPEGSPAPAAPPTTSLRSRAALSTYATAVQGVARLLYSVLIGNLGSRELLGQTNTSLSLSVLTSQLWAAPASAAGTRFVALRAALGDAEGAAAVGRHIATRTALISLVLPTVVALGGSLWLGFGPAHTVGTVLLAFAYSLYSTSRGIQYGALRFRHVAMWDTVAGGLALVAVTLVLVLDLTALALLPLALGYGVFAAVSWPARSQQRVEPALRREIDHFVLFGALSGVASGGLLQLSQLAAHAYAGPAEAGDFAAALTLATPAAMLSVALATVLIPPLTAAAGRGDREGVRRQSDAIARRLTAIFVGLMGVLVILSPLVITVVWGEEYVGATTVLPVLLVAVMLTSIAQGAATTLQSTRVRGPRAVAYLNVGGFVASVATWPFLAPRLGIDGVALGYLVGAGLASLAMMATVWRVERHRWLDLTARLVGGTALAVALFLVTHRLEGLGGVLAQVGAALAFGLVWLALTRRDVLALWATLRGREAPSATS